MVRLFLLYSSSTLPKFSTGSSIRATPGAVLAGIRLSNILQIPLLYMSAVTIRGLIFVSCILRSCISLCRNIPKSDFGSNAICTERLLHPPTAQKSSSCTLCQGLYTKPLRLCPAFNATARDMTMLPQHFCRIVHPIESGNHAQRSRTAIGGIMSPVIRENVYFSSSLLWIFIKLILYTYH